MTHPEPQRLSRRQRRALERPQRRQKRDTDRRIREQAQKLLTAHQSAPTFWLGEPCHAQRVKVRLHGRTLAAVKVAIVNDNNDIGLLYLDDTGGAGWLKVTAGKGAAHLPHRELDLETLEEV